MGRGQGHRAVPICRSGVSRVAPGAGVVVVASPPESPRPRGVCTHEPKNQNREPVEPGPVVVVVAVAVSVWLTKRSLFGGLRCGERPTQLKHITQWRKRKQQRLLQ